MEEPPVGDEQAPPATVEGSAPAPPAEAELRTFLIADIRGYTKFTETHGADAAADLATRFAAIVRDVVAAHEGFLLELRGDEALVVFILARRALRAALDLQARFNAELPQGVGIGLDAGEAIPVEGGYRGSALNLAARLCGQAGPGETLASEAVIHLAARVEGVGYTDPRTYRIKGMDEPIRAVHVVPAGKGTDKPIRYGRDRGRDRSLLVIGGVAGLAIIIAVVALSGAFGGLGGAPTPTRTPTASAIAVPSTSTSPTATASATASPVASAGPLGDAELPLIAFIDPVSGSVTDTKPVQAPTDGAFFAADAFWIFTLDPLTLREIDAVSHAPLRSFAIPLPNPGSASIDDGTIWFVDAGSPRLVGVDIRTGVLAKDWFFGANPEDERGASGLTVGDGSLWVSLQGDDFGQGEIIRLGLSSGEEQARITDLDFPEVLSFGEGAIWFTGGGKMSRLDPATNRVTFTTDLAQAYLPFIAFGGGAAWTASDEQGKVWKVNQSGRPTEYDVGVGARGLALLGETMWVAVQDAGKIVGIDVTTGAQRDIDVGHQVLGITADGDELLVSVEPTPEERIAELAGDVLTIASPFQPFFNPDPPANGSFEFRQLGYITCAGLLRYQDAPAPDGWQLVPEVAAAMPEVSPDGMTYSFTIRDGFVFSPPSDEAVTAETFRYTIERALSPVLESFNARWLSDIEGAEAYMAGEAPTLSGVEASGDQLTIRLTESSGDFLNRLTLPYFCPVPIGTPAVRDGLDPTPPLSSAGPYYMAAHYGGELMILMPNPNYAGERETPWDAIGWRVGFTPGEVIGRVESGRVDAATGSPFDPLMNAQSDRAQEWGPLSEAAAAGDQRWFGGPRFGSEFLHLNPARLFADVDVRRAVGLAIDRPALAAWFGEQPFSGLLAPSVPGSLPADSQVPASDIEAAQALMAGRTEAVVMGVFANCDECEDIADTVAGALAEIGIAVEVRAVDNLIEEIADPQTEIDMFNGFLDSDYPDPVALLGRLAENDWIGEENLAELERLGTLSGKERIDAAAAFAARMSDAEAYAIPYAYPIYPMYLGEHVGCGFVQPALGAVDLLSLCLEP